MWQGDQSLQACEPVPLLLPSQVTNIPTDAVHREETAACVRLAESLKPPLEFAASKAQLHDERMWHGFWSFYDKNRYLFSRVPEKEDNFVPVLATWNICSGKRAVILCWLRGPFVRTTRRFLRTDGPRSQHRWNHRL